MQTSGRSSPLGRWLMEFYKSKRPPRLGRVLNTMEDESASMDMDTADAAQATINTNMNSSGYMGDDVTYPNMEYPNLPKSDPHDWKYKMRRTCQEIVPNLYLGPYACATRASLEQMKTIGFTHVVCVREVMERQFIRPNHPDHFKYLIIELSDTMNDNIIPHLKVMSKFLDDCLNEGGRALVHGNGGNSRSASLVMGYLMWRFGIDAVQAHYYVQQKRFCVCPSDSFLVQLREYEPIYKALQVVPLVLPALPTNKRPLDDNDDDRTVKYVTHVGDDDAEVEPFSAE